jgi:putative FmdB family regulatory protein
MPTYEYICKDCGHAFEIVRSMKDDALTVCPECGGTLRKVFGAPAISFKGSGFYATDHGRKARAGGDKGDTGEKKTSSTTDTKSGTRTDTKDGGSPSGGSRDGSSSGGSKESSSSGGSKESPSSGGSKASPSS